MSASILGRGVGSVTYSPETSTGYLSLKLCCYLPLISLWVLRWTLTAGRKRADRWVWIQQHFPF